MASLVIIFISFVADVNRGSGKSSSHKHGQSSEHNNKNSSYSLLSKVRDYSTSVFQCKLVCC